MQLSMMKPDSNLQNVNNSQPNEEAPESNSIKETVMSIFKFILLICLPVFSYIYLKKNFSKLDDLEFQTKFGTLY